MHSCSWLGIPGSGNVYCHFSLHHPRGEGGRKERSEVREGVGMEGWDGGRVEGGRKRVGWRKGGMESRVGSERKWVTWELELVRRSKVERM